MTIRKRITLVSSLLLALFCFGAVQESAQGASTTGSQHQSASAARAKRIAQIRRQRRIARIKARRLARIRAQRAQAAEVSIAMVQPFVPPATGEQTPPTGPGNGSTGGGGGEVPEPALWMGLASSAAVMLVASRWRRRRS